MMVDKFIYLKKQKKQKTKGDLKYHKLSHSFDEEHSVRLCVDVTGDVHLWFVPVWDKNVSIIFFNISSKVFQGFFFISVLM